FPLDGDVLKRAAPQALKDGVVRHHHSPRLGEDARQVDPGLPGTPPDPVAHYVDVVHHPPEVDPDVRWVDDQVVPDDGAAYRQRGTAVIDSAVDVDAVVGVPEGAVPDDCGRLLGARAPGLHDRYAVVRPPPVRLSLQPLQEEPRAGPPDGDQDG